MSDALVHRARPRARRRPRHRRLAVRVVEPRRAGEGRGRTRASSTQGALARRPGGLADPRLRVPGHRGRARWPPALAGFVGTLGVFALGYGAARAVRRARRPRRRRRERALQPRPRADRARGRPGEPGPPARPAREARRPPRRDASSPCRRRWRRWPVWVACAARRSRSRGRRRACAAREIWRRARLVLPLVLFVARLRAVRAHGRGGVSLGPLTVTRRGSRCSPPSRPRRRSARSAPCCSARRRPSRPCCAASRRCACRALLVLIAAFMYRYLFVIVDEVQRMRAALAARGYRAAPRCCSAAPSAAWRARSSCAPTRRGERVYLAMLARGYDGRCRELEPLRFGRADVAFVAARARAAPRAAARRRGAA